MRLFQEIKNWKTVRGWHIWKLKLVDARLYFVSMVVGLLTGLIAVPYHYLLYYLLHVRSGLFAACAAGKRASQHDDREEQAKQFLNLFHFLYPFCFFHVLLLNRSI